MKHETNFYLGIYFFFLHSCLFYGTSLVYFMTERLSSLILLLVNVIIIYFCNVIFKDCPINTIEKYHMKKNSFINLIALILPIQYNKENENESILQFIFTIMTIVYGKILYVVLKKSIISFYKWVKTSSGYKKVHKWVKLK
jgi:hypothetical protein